MSYLEALQTQMFKSFQWTAKWILYCAQCSTIEASSFLTSQSILTLQICRFIDGLQICSCSSADSHNCVIIILKETLVLCESLRKNAAVAFCVAVALLHHGGCSVELPKALALILKLVVLFSCFHCWWIPTCGNLWRRLASVLFLEKIHPLWRSVCWVLASLSVLPVRADNWHLLSVQQVQGRAFHLLAGSCFF